jgi:hypothetical protein
MSTTPNPLIANLLARQNSAPIDTVNAPALTSMIAAPSNPSPSLGSSIAPAQTTVNPFPNQLQTDQTSRNQLINSGDGISQVKNPLLRGIARAADIAGTVFLPNLARAIPGTMLHHNMLVNQATQNVAQDQAQQQAATTLQDSQAQVQQRQALAQQEQAKAAALANPQKAGDPTKTVQTDDGVFQFNPDTGKYDNRVGDKVEKPKTIEEQAYDFAVKSGKNPLDAYGAVYGAKNTKDAGLPQQYLDAISSGDTVKAGLIKKVINDTSTAPKIQVINAGAANREAAKTAGLDTSDPSIRASVAAVADGSMKLADVFGRGATTAQKAQFAAAVKQVNPNYNSGDHDIENASRKYFISGQGGSTLTAGNTLTHHLDLYDKAADAVHNGDIKALNQIGNELGVQLGSDAQTNLSLIRRGVASEAARFYTGGVPGETEIEGFMKDLSGDGSPQSMHGGANTVRAMARGKLQGMQAQADAGSKGQANFGGNAPQGGSGLAVSLKDAMALPQNKGKSEADVRDDIQSHGHTVKP